MKNFYFLLRTVSYAVLFILVGITNTNANDLLKEKRIVLVGSPSQEAGDQNLMDSLNAWMTASSMLASDFRMLNENAFDTIDCVLFSETILSTDVPGFGVDLEFPVPSIVMEMSVFGNEADKWNLLEADGVIEGHASAAAEDLQWKIYDNSHYITEIYQIGQIVDYATGDANRGMAYIKGFLGDVDVLAIPNSKLENEDAAAIAVLNDYDILFMSIAKIYPADGVATPDLFKVLKRGCEFLLDAIPVVEEPSGINDNALDQNFKLTTFPNPAVDNLTVKFVADNNYDISVTILDITGKQMSLLTKESRHGSNYLSFDVSNYQAGLYFVNLKVGDKTAKIKFMIK